MTSLDQFKCLHGATLSFKELEQLIIKRNLTDYTVKAIKDISKKLGEFTKERTFEGYALEAVVGEQLEENGFEVIHNKELNVYWYDLIAGGIRIDVKKHGDADVNPKWLTLQNSVLEKGGQLKCIIDDAPRDKVYLLFINVSYQKIENDVNCIINPAWLIRADSLLNNLKKSSTPGYCFYQFNDAKEGTDFIRFPF